jgi:hypothetical protein
MVDGIHIPIQNNMMKLLSVVLTGVGRGLPGVGGGGGGSDLTNVQCKAIWNCQTESPFTMSIANIIWKNWTKAWLKW